LLLTQPSNRINRKVQRNRKRKHRTIRPVSRFLGKNLFLESVSSQKIKKGAHYQGRTLLGTYTQHVLLVTRLLNLTSSTTLKQVKNVYLKKPRSLDIRHKSNLLLTFKKLKSDTLLPRLDLIRRLSVKGTFHSLAGVDLLSAKINNSSVFNWYSLPAILITGSGAILRRLEGLTNTIPRFKKTESLRSVLFYRRPIWGGSMGVRQKPYRTILPYLKSLCVLKPRLNLAEKPLSHSLFKPRVYTQKLSYLYNLLQKKYIRSRFLRFFNYAVSTKNFQVSTQIFVKETSRDQVN
jgi:hypothetical protein